MVEPNIQFSMNDKAILGIPVHERNCEEILQNANSKKVSTKSILSIRDEERPEGDIDEGCV